MERGAPAGLVRAAQHGGEARQRDAFIGKLAFDHRDQVDRRLGIGVKHADLVRARGGDAGIDLPRAAPLAGENAPTRRFGQRDGCVGAAPVDEHDFVRLRVERGHLFDQHRQHLGLVEHGDNQRHAHGRNSGQSAKSSGSSTSASSGSTAGAMSASARRASVRENTLSVLHSMSPNRKDTSRSKPIR